MCRHKIDEYFLPVLINDIELITILKYVQQRIGHASDGLDQKLKRNRAWKESSFLCELKKSSRRLILKVVKGTNALEERESGDCTFFLLIHSLNGVRCEWAREVFYEGEKWVI